MYLKSVLSEALLQSRGDIRKMKNVPFRNRWDYFFEVENEFMVEIKRISNYSAMIQVYNLLDFRKDSNKAAKSSVTFKKEPFEDEFSFEATTENVSAEIAKYTYELIGRSLSALNATNNR